MKGVIYKKVINENKENRTEFLLINFDYEDGNDYLAKIFNKEFNMKVEEKKDYIWFSIIKLCKKNICYELLWHEDIGNIIYSLEQDEAIPDVTIEYKDGTFKLIEVQSKTDTEDDLTNKLKNIQNKYGKDVVREYDVEEPKGGK